MKLIDNLIVSLFPKYGLKRMQARMAVKAYYEAGQANNFYKKRVSNNDPDVEVGEAAEDIRASARHLEQNYDLAKGVLNTLTSNVVGMGIQPIPLIKKADGSLHKEANKVMLKLYKNWERLPEVTGELDNASAQRLTFKTLIRDGEVLIQILRGRINSLDHGTEVPLSYELIESDYLPMSLEDDKKGIVQGVQKNKWGRPKNYFLYKSQPSVTGLFTNLDTKRVSADNIIHLKMTDRIRQTRGVSIFASVMKRFDDIKDIEESERVAARVAAAMAGFIKKGSPDMYLAPEGDKVEREMEFMPGMIFDDLNIGEEVQTTNSNRPNNDIIPFIDTNLRFAAAGTSTSFSSISKNYNGTYSAQRQELVESRMGYGILWSYFCKRSVQPIYEEFVNMAISIGALDKFNDIDDTTILEADFTRPPLTWIDPKKEMDGIAQEISTGISSKGQVIRRRGGDAEETLQQRIEENKEEKAAGLIEENKPAPNTGG